MNKTLQSFLADIPLVKNTDNPEYMNIILEGCSTLEERFVKIDSNMVVEKVMIEKKEQQRGSPKMKKDHTEAGFS